MDKSKQRKKANILATLKLLNGMQALHHAAYASSFITLLREGKTLLANSFFKYFIAPVAALVTCFDIIFAWRLFYLEQSSFTLTHALITTLTGFALIAAAIGLSMGAAIFGVVAPILFAISMSVTCIYKLSMGIYFSYHASTQQRFFKESASYQRVANESFFEAATSALLAGTTIALIFVAAPVAQIVLTSVGLATTLGALIYAAVKSYRLASASEQLEKHQLDHYSTAIISIGLDTRPSNPLTLANIDFNLPSKSVEKIVQSIDSDIAPWHRSTLSMQ